MDINYKALYFLWKEKENIYIYIRIAQTSTQFCKQPKYLLTEEWVNKIWHIPLTAT